MFTRHPKKRRTIDALGVLVALNVILVLSFIVRIVIGLSCTN